MTTSQQPRHHTSALQNKSLQNRLTVVGSSFHSLNLSRLAAMETGNLHQTWPVQHLEVWHRLVSGAQDSVTHRNFKQSQRDAVEEACWLWSVNLLVRHTDWCQ